MKKKLTSVGLAAVAVICVNSAFAEITYDYDHLHRLVRVTYDDGTAIVYEYDAVGNRVMRVMNSDADVVYLHVTIDPPWGGQVLRDPDMTWYPIGAAVELTAQGQGNYEFVEWRGDVPPGQEQDNPLTITLDDYTSVGAHFGSSCSADIDGSGVVDFADVLAVLGAWGNHGGPEDLDGSGIVDFGDLVVVLAHWGPC